MTGVQVEGVLVVLGGPEPDRQTDGDDQDPRALHQAALVEAGLSVGAEVDGRLPAGVALAGTRA